MVKSLAEKMRPYQIYMYQIVYPRIEKLLEQEKEKLLEQEKEKQNQQ